jgi:DNA-binding GntR family transcriptional regulator
MIEYQTKAAIAYDVIFSKISSGSYKPGSKLVIRQLSKELNISEIPIREAIKKLESEGYVVHDANKSVTVCSWGLDEVTHFFQIKGVLEGYASRTSAIFLTDDDIAVLQEINDEMKEACQNRDFSRVSSLNQRFHLKIYEKNPNRELVQLIESLWRKWAVTKRVFSISPDRAYHSIVEHDEIIRLIRERKVDELEVFVRKHKFEAGEEMVAAVADRS